MEFITHIRRTKNNFKTVGYMSMLFVSWLI